MKGAASLVLFSASCGIYRGKFTFYLLKYGSGVERIGYCLSVAFECDKS